VDGVTFLLDSSIVVQAFRRHPAPAIADRFRELVGKKQAAVNGIVRLEVLLGYKTEDLLEAARIDLEALRQLPITENTWTGAARLGFDLARRGIIVKVPDLIIAASAIEHGAVLVHADSDFDRIASHSTLRVESYAAV
jgi:predicted nucleic acid-binding protein